ncbi:transcription elongation factor SPT5 [Pelomyxa schiedti]|nr:transcription elongation factor SPT5 [Pelomyxa schiedti]
MADDDYDDDAAEQGDDDDDEDYEDTASSHRSKRGTSSRGGGGGGKRRRKGGKSGGGGSGSSAPVGAEFYLDTMAEESSAEEEDDGLDDDSGFIANDNEIELEEGATGISLPPRRPSGRGGRVGEAGGVRRSSQEYGLHRDLAQGNDVAAIVSGIEQRNTSYYENDIQDDSITRRQLPSVYDPKMWAVRCRPSKELESVVGLMRRFFENCCNTNAIPGEGEEQIQQQPICANAAVVNENLKGYFYIEADREQDARHAISGLRQIFQQKLKLVPIKEMADVLASTPPPAPPQPNDWARVKRGLYKGDLAQVVEVDEARARITVRLVPRLDVAALKSGAATEEGEVLPTSSGAGRGRKPPTRPGVMRKLIPARFFNPSEFDGLGNDLQHKTDAHGDYVLLRGSRFQDGYLIKTIASQGVELHNVNPTLDEIRRFMKQDDSIDTAALNRARSQKFSTIFTKGDSVCIQTAELKDMIATVTSVGDDGKVNVQARANETVMNLQFEPDDLLKVFKCGDHVKVLNGRHEGETGLIVHVNGNTTTILSDISHQELTVLTSDIHESSDVGTSGKQELGTYQLFDLVQLSPQQVGMIIKIEGHSFRILDNLGQIKVIPLQSMGHKRGNPKNEMCMDSRSNSVSVGDLVQVIDGPQKGRQARVRHIFRFFCFLNARDFNENCGNFVAKANTLLIVGGAKPYQGPAFGRGRGSSDRGRGAERGGFGRGRGRGESDGGGAPPPRLSFGSTVRITKGPWKGYKGILRSKITDDPIRVELLTNGKKVTVPDSSAVDADDLFKTPSVPLPQASDDWASSAHPPDTDYRNTPSRTPSRTPSHPPVTPSRDPWNAANPNTPAHAPESPWTDQGKSWGAEEQDTQSYSSSSSFAVNTPIPTPANAPYTPSSNTPSTPALSSNIPTVQTPSSSFPYTPAAYSELPQTPGIDMSHHNPSTPHVSTPITQPVHTPAQTQYEETAPFTPHHYPPSDVYTPQPQQASTPGVYTPYFSPNPQSYSVNTPATTTSSSQYPLTPQQQTPGMIYTPQQQQIPQNAQARTPIPSTPQQQQPPPTPDTQWNPATPATPMMPPTTAPSDDWIMPGLIVSYAGAGYKIVSMGPGSSMCTIVGLAGGGPVEVNNWQVEPMVPVKHDKVCVTRGEHRGKYGTLIGGFEKDGIVKLNNVKDISILQLTNLCKAADN